MTRIAIGSDHAGFELKSHLIDLLGAEGHDVVDLGTDSTESVDYPKFCAAVGRVVRDGDADLGIVLGGSVGLAPGYRLQVEKQLATLPAAFHVPVYSAHYQHDAGLMGAALWSEYHAV